jgi:hypothetical protein
MALPLKEVTLICFDTRNIDAAIESMNFSLGQIHFAESILFTTKALCSDSAINKANKLGIKLEFISQVSSISEYSYFILVNLEKYIKTKFCLVTQWDGWVINREKWNNNFLNFDYIGAIWPDYLENQIGNGGFSLRSKKFLESTKDYLLAQSDIPKLLVEDDFICRIKRIEFEEKYQIKFPDIKLANKFSIEGNGLPIECFGFHSMSNFHAVLDKDSDLKRFINMLIRENFVNRESYDLTKNLLNENRFSVAKLIINKRFESNGLSKKHIKLNIFLYYRKLLIKVKNVFK